MQVRSRAYLRGFSLVEVLIAVLVLSLGLLGLGAVFPVIVRQQQIATQTTMGNSAKQGIEQVLANNANFQPGGRGWNALREYIRTNQTTPGYWVSIQVDRRTGNYELDPDPLDPNTNLVTLPLAQRLYPLPMVSQTAPQFVWDMAARLLRPNDPAKSALEVVAFVRPIDPGIRRPFNPTTEKPYSLTTTLLNPFGDISERETKYPVSTDNRGRPTYDGSKGRASLYSIPIVAEVSLPGTSPDANQMLLDKIMTANTDMTVANQVLGVPGKRFLDRNGKLYRVVSTQSLGSTRLLIRFDPPFPDPEGNGVQPAEINPIIFVPQDTPIKPFVFQVQPRDLP